MASDIETIIKMLLKHDRLINALAQTAGDQARLLLPILASFEQCSKEHCSKPATLEHKFLGMKMCDRCSAETIVKSGRSFTADEADVLNPVRSTLMKEDDWEDLPEAECIRRTEDYVSILKSDNLHQKH